MTGGVGLSVRLEARVQGVGLRGTLSETGPHADVSSRFETDVFGRAYGMFCRRGYGSSV